MTSIIKYGCNVTVESVHNGISKTISCLVVPKISNLFETEI